MHNHKSNFNINIQSLELFDKQIFKKLFDALLEKMKIAQFYLSKHLYMISYVEPNVQFIKTSKICLKIDLDKYN